MPRTGRPPFDLPIERIRELAALQMTTSEIAADIGYSQKAVWGAMRRNEIPRLPQKARPEHNHFWNGGRTVDRDGYILVKSPSHPHATAIGYVREHRLVMEGVLGRYLEPQEVVDHIDGDTSNNDPGNLRLFPTNAEHLRVTLAGRVPRWSPEGKARLMEAVRKPRRRRPTDPSATNPVESENGGAR